MIKNCCLLILLASISVLSYGQSGSSEAVAEMDSKHKFTYEDLDTLTKVRLGEFYSNQDIEELKRDINKLKYLNYSIAGSFKVKEGQEYEVEDYLKIDMSQYSDLVEEDSIVEVYDEESGLFLLIDSKQIAANKLDRLGVELEWQKPASTSKTTD